LTRTPRVRPAEGRIRRFRSAGGWIRRLGPAEMLFLAPAVLLLTAVILLPVVLVLPTGLRHASLLADDPLLLPIARNTLLFAAASLPLELILGTLSALLLDRQFRGRGVVRSFALLPWALPTAVMAMAWRWIFNDTYGMVSALAALFGASGSAAWLGDPTGAFWILVAADVWKTTPFVTVLVLAGLQSIPSELHEAMEVDGAGPVRRFFWITLPLLRPALAIAIVFRLIQALGIFDLPWVLTGGGPANATRTIAIHIYDQYFRFGESGYGAAITLAAAAGMFALAGGIGLLVRGRRRWA